MRVLPRISIPAVEIHLPLADCTSLALESALLADDRDARRAELTALMADDPSFAIWTVCQAALNAGIELRSIDAAAGWLADHLPRQLASLPDDAPDRAASDEFAKLAGFSVALSEAAARFAQQDGGVDPDEVRLAALLHRADDWLRLASEPTITEQDLAACLPVWLGSDAIVTRYIHRALGEAENAEGSPAIVHHWQTEDEGTRRRLPALVARLARLDQFEHDFQAALELEKLKSMRQLAYGAGHEINNPLANISARAQTLLRDERDPERRRRLAAINSQAFRAHEMIADLMLFSHPPELDPEPVELVALADRIVAEMAADAQSRGTTLSRDGADSPVTVLADLVQLSVALRAICTNALEALGRGGNIVLSVQSKVSADIGPAAEIAVADDGPGIAPEVRRHLFDPFYSGREAGRGLGFGLAKCWRIVTDHGGGIEVESTPGRGATFTITLPAAVPCSSIPTAG